MNTRKTGKFGEDLATNYLEGRGYEVVCKNWLCKGGEIDIITLDKNKTLVFVEVKFVRGQTGIKAYELFGSKKAGRLKKAVLAYLATKDIKTDWRMDLLCITKKNNSIEFNQYTNVLADF